MTEAEARDAVAIAQPGDFPDELLQTAASWLLACQQKLGPVRKTEPPTKQQAAEFLAVAHWGKLHNFLSGLIARRTPTGASYGWYIQAALKAVYEEEEC